ncbi:MAG: class A beta-lactamase-related serine hydrolase [Candidatus Gastranaerophilales bacterium]|nr:class A beta-lactamase-related serine hydrolase [Candidatus Gastranaerophilales bacterium]MCM1072492.1 class A beta-lactamase-related serine hydrolase [Bacteroides sp.]
MYAYREQTQVRPLHAVPQRRKPVSRVVRKKKVKKQNPLAWLFRTTLLLSFLSVFIVFVHPTAYNSLIRQVFFPTNLSTTTGFENTMKTENPCYRTNVDLYRMANPITNYLHNDMFNNELLLTPTLQKSHSEVTTMYHTTEIASLKQQLNGLMAQYPAIKPSIYVWEYEQGQYIDVNANELYPSASIIKLPVLVRMFKSIEAGQFKLNDEMKMIEQYRSSGSGNLQYSQAGNNYTMDYLAKIMIQDSDNTSTNMIMAKMGGMDDVNIGLRDWGISKTYVRTWLPDLKGTNKTTAYDIAKILYNLDNPGFLTINSRESIIDYMSHVKNDRLIQAGLGEGALFIHKTGDIGTMLGDAGIVYAPNGKKYIVVILAMRPHNSYQGKEFIVKASEMIYKAIAG